MPKGYWIVRVDVNDPDAYRRYIEANAEPIRRFGGRFLVRGGRSEAVEGAARARNVVVEFESYEAARNAYFDAGYQEAKALREATSETDFLVIEGYDGPQPGEGLPPR
jgi:uncharacterized protein (DUF1330 family)